MTEQDLTHKNVLVTGSSGYVGSALVRWLEAHTSHVVGGIDENRRGDPGQIGGFVGDYAWLQLHQLEACDVIVHLAADATVQECDAKPMLAWYNNLVHAVNLASKLTESANPARAARGLPPVTLIYASTGSLYSTNGVSSVYDVTKRALEEAMRVFYPAAVGLRFATVCGPSPNMRRTLLNAMVEDALTHGVVRVSNPTVRRPVVDIREVCAVIQHFIDEPVPGVHPIASYTDTIEGHALAVVKFLGDAEMERAPDSPSYDFTMPGDTAWRYGRGDTIDALVQDFRERAGRAAEVEA